MLSFNKLCALVVVLIVSWSQLAFAHSAPARLLKRVSQPSTIAIEILPRQQQITPSLSHKRSPLYARVLRHDDSFRLTITAFDNKFYLHLRPNHHLIHPAARVTYHSTNANGDHITTTIPITRESVRAYWGEVIDATHTATRLREDAAQVLPQHHPSVLGWARITVHNQGDTELGIEPEFEGAFTINGVLHHITTKDNYIRNKDPLDPDVSTTLNFGDEDSSLVIWRDSDVMSADEEHFARSGDYPRNSSPPLSCGHDRLPYNSPFVDITSNSWDSASFGNLTLRRRQDVAGDGMGTNFLENIGDSTGCPKTPKVLYMGVAADCNYVQRYGSQTNATRQILTAWNSASAMYKTFFNVSLGIVEIQVQQPNCPEATDPVFPWNIPCPGVDLDERLSIFSKWRGDKGEDDIGLWHLMSGCPTRSEVGIAWLGTLCRESVSGSAPNFVSGTAVSTAGRTEWQVIAHEIGHNFGAIHDCADGCNISDACCPRSADSCSAGTEFVMSPVTQPGEKVFSQCTLGNVCSLLGNLVAGKLDSTCLVDPDPNRQTIQLSMCGNGIVERGEECDPGVGIESACCNSTTCKLLSNASCDPRSSPCCTDQCSFAPSTQMCRPSMDARCDTPEFCTGNSSSCPADSIAPNGQSCGAGELKCASGTCTSVALQCQTIGASMGLKEACPSRSDDTCQVSCQDPARANQCILLTSLLIDGSPCGFGGTCASGKCQSADFITTAKAWYTQNLQISIPVTVVAGLVGLLILWAMLSSLRRCCARKPKTTPIPDPILRPRGLAAVPGAIGAGATAYGSSNMHNMAMKPTYEGRPRNYDRPTAGLRTPSAPSALTPGGSSASYSRLGTGGDNNGMRTTYESPFETNQDTRNDWVDESTYNGPRRS